MKEYKKFGKTCDKSISNEQGNQIILRSLTTFTRQQLDAQEDIINSLKKQLEKSQNGKNNFDKNCEISTQNCSNR